MENAAIQKNQNRAFLIRSKIKVLRQRMENLKETAADFLSESRMQQIINVEQSEKTTAKDKSGFVLSRFFVGIIRTIMGKPWSLISKPIEKHDELEKAYLYEISRRYEQSIQVYEQLVKQKKYKDSSIKDYIQLHLAYCYTMLGQYSYSKSIYLSLLNSAGKKEIRELALNLLDFLIYSEKKLALLLKTGLTSLTRAERLYYYRDFKKAQKLLKKYVKNKRAYNRQKAVYLLGRCEEEQGQLKKALMTYTEVILIRDNTFWAKMANRRLFIIGKFYRKNKKLTSFAKKKSSSYHDDAFFKKVDAIVKAVPETENTNKRSVISKKNRIVSSSLEKRLKQLSTKKKKKIIIPVAYQKAVKLLSKHYRVINRIVMKDGNVFIGSIIKRDAVKITVATVFGFIPLRKKDIRSIIVIFSK